MSSNERDPLLNSQAIVRQRRTASKKRFAFFTALALVFAVCILAIALPLALTSSQKDDADVIAATERDNDVTTSGDVDQNRTDVEDAEMESFAMG